MKRISSIIFAVFITLLASGQTLQDGLKAIDSDKYEHARDIFKSLIEQEPTKGDFHYYLGQAYFNLFKSDLAKSAYEKGIKVDPINPANYAGLGELLLEDNKIPEAKEKFDKALSLSRNRNGKVTDIRALSLVAASMVSTENKLLAEAEALVNQAYDLTKKNYDALITAGDVYLEKNDGGNAATNYERAMSINPSNPKAYTRVAVIWLRVRNFEATQNDLNRAFEKDPNYAPALKYQAELYYSQRKYELAKETYKKYLSNSEESVANKIRFSQMLFKSKEYDEALIKINEVIELDRSNLYLFRIKAYSTAEIVGNKSNDTAKASEGIIAIEHFMKNIDSSKILASDYECLGKLQAKFPDKDSLALYNFGIALRMDSNRFDVYPEMAKVNNRLKRFEQAGQNYEVYISKAPRVSTADWYLMGKAYYFGKVYDKAEAAFAKVNELRPEYADAYFWRANSLSGLDPDFKLEDAKTQYEKYLDISINDPKFAANKDRIKKDLVTSYSYLGYYNLVREKKAETKEMYKKVLELDPDNSNAKKVLAELK